MKKITIASNSIEPITFESEATNLGELKEELRGKNINFSGMTFKEGVTRTVLLDDSSVLPTVKADGSIIDELFIMMSGATKKIKSGSERTDLYTKVKDILKNNPNLKAEIGNYTCKSNTALIAFTNKYFNTSKTTTNKSVMTTKSSIITKEQAIECLEKVMNYLTNSDNIIVNEVYNNITEKPVEIKKSVTIKTPVPEKLKSTFSKSELLDMMDNLED